MKVHHVNVAKVAYYNEFSHRAKAFFDDLQKGKFMDFDRDELQKLESLQKRAVQYVSYYMKVSFFINCIFKRTCSSENNIKFQVCQRSFQVLPN